MNTNDIRLHPAYSIIDNHIAVCRLDAADLNEVYVHDVGGELELLLGDTEWGSLDPAGPQSNALAAYYLAQLEPYEVDR